MIHFRAPNNQVAPAPLDSPIATLQTDDRSDESPLNDNNNDQIDLSAPANASCILERSRFPSETNDSISDRVLESQLSKNCDWFVPADFSPSDDDDEDDTHNSISRASDGKIISFKDFICIRKLNNTRSPIGSPSIREKNNKCKSVVIKILDDNLCSNFGCGCCYMSVRELADMFCVTGGIISITGICAIFMAIIPRNQVRISN